MFSFKDYKPPEKIETSTFIIRKLEARDAELDYKAVMSSIDTIKKQRGGTWPTTELTLEEDAIDLGWHQREFEFGSSFAYVVTNPGGDEQLGCVYFYPPKHPMDSATVNIPEGTDAVVNLWVTQKAFDQGFYDELYHFVEHWLPDWPFKNPYMSNLLKPKIK